MLLASSRIEVRGMLNSTLHWAAPQQQKILKSQMSAVLLLRNPANPFPQPPVMTTKTCLQTVPNTAWKKLNLPLFSGEATDLCRSITTHENTLEKQSSSLNGWAVLLNSSAGKAWRNSIRSNSFYSRNEMRILRPREYSFSYQMQGFQHHSLKHFQQGTSSVNCSLKMSSAIQ